MSKSSKIIISAALVIVIALAFCGGFFFNQWRHPTDIAALDIVKQAWQLISSEYVDQTRLDSANMTRAAIEGIIDTLDDPYTAYLSPAEYNGFLISLQGEYAGIGAIVSVQDANIVILDPIPGSPAEKIGLKSGDIILEINGESATGMNIDIAVGKIRGLVGTTVKLLVLRKGESVPVELDIVRAMVELPSVAYEMRDDIAYISIYQFTDRTEIEIAPVIRKLKTDGAKGIVLDLRGNGGGWLDIVIEVASHFIPEGVIVKVRSNQGTIETHNAISGEETTSLPMVVLVDNFSASGAEVLAGALQDHQRALVSGNTTFGKGSVNTPHRLSDGSGLYITIARWLTPNDRLIEGQGIEPDVKLELTGEDAIQWAIDYLHGIKSP
jgi:carboxyl-terminal processing protease